MGNRPPLVGAVMLENTTAPLVRGYDDRFKRGSRVEPMAADLRGHGGDDGNAGREAQPPATWRAAQSASGAHMLNPPVLMPCPSPGFSSPGFGVANGHGRLHRATENGLERPILNCVSRSCGVFIGSVARRRQDYGSAHDISYSIDGETHRRLADRADRLRIDASKL